MVSLRITHPDGRTQDYPIPENSATIGRSPKNHISLKDDAVSRRHAKLVREEEGERFIT